MTSPHRRLVIAAVITAAAAAALSNQRDVAVVQRAAAWRDGFLAGLDRRREAAALARFVAGYDRATPGR